jgi:hypothetical protein
LPERQVLPQVALSSIIEGESGNRIGLNKINQKSVGFAICLEDFKTVTVVELDDASHKRKNRKHADAMKDVALKSAGIEIVHWTRMPEAADSFSRCLS